MPPKLLKMMVNQLLHFSNWVTSTTNCVCFSSRTYWPPADHVLSASAECNVYALESSNLHSIDYLVTGEDFWLTYIRAHPFRSHNINIILSNNCSGSPWNLQSGKASNKDSKAQSTCKYALCMHVMNVWIYICLCVCVCVCACLGWKRFERME